MSRVLRKKMHKATNSFLSMQTQKVTDDANIVKTIKLNDINDFISISFPLKKGSPTFWVKSIIPHTDDWVAEHSLCSHEHEKTRESKLAP